MLAALSPGLGALGPGAEKSLVQMLSTIGPGGEEARVAPPPPPPAPLPGPMPPLRQMITTSSIAVDESLLASFTTFSTSQPSAHAYSLDGGGREGGGGGGGGGGGMPRLNMEAVNHRIHLKANTKEDGLRQHLRVCGDVDRDCASEGACVCVHTYIDTYVYTYILMYVHTCGDADGDCVSDGVSPCIDTYEYT
jgi:hypothetical protein